MEVHHHPDLHHKSKPWKEYFLEFLMIFLAVTMGFFAESIREYSGDRSKEKEFMISMVQDLKADTAEVGKTVKNYTRISAMIDTMLITLKSGKPNPAIIDRLVSNRFWAYTGFSYNNNTIQQLKSSGNFRLVLKKNVADSILRYDNLETAFPLNQYTDLKNTLMTYKYAEAKIIHYQDLQPASDYGERFNKDDFSINTNYITSDKELLSTYYNDLFIHGALCHTFLINLRTAGARAANLITFIKKEYKLEDE